MRRTKIVATIGPKTESEEMLFNLSRNGMNIVRINMSHGDKAWHEMIMKRIRELNKKTVFPVSLMIDTQGPEIRTSGKEVKLKEGEIFKIAVSSACDIQEGEKHTFILHEDLINKVNVGGIILIDDGLVAVEVLEVEPYHFLCKVLNQGSIGNRKTVTIPGIKTGLPAITEKDKEDIRLVVKHGADFIAQSFVRGKKDIEDMRSLLKSLNSGAMIIAKIEDQQGVDSMDEIIEASDGVMVARGDLGVEVPLEDIPILQKEMVKKCIEQGKPVIIATHLLESMIVNPRPTRAEVIDVANAVYEKADCIMLSGETTKGQYPVECVKTMATIAKNVQKKLSFELKNGFKTKDVKEALSLGACINAENLDAKAIIVFSRTGRLLSRVTRKRPNTDIFVFTESEEVMRRMTIFWGAFPFRIKFRENSDEMIREAIGMLKQKEFLIKGDRAIIISDISPKKNIDILEIREIE
ncbi:pyruvate kinase [Candidatus Woesearchaeota archaeon]|nr:pyruvate kinase [Candidatus Woesearchaeota archaeon]